MTQGSRLPRFLAMALLAASLAAPAHADVTIASIGPLSTFRPYAAVGIMRGTELMIDAVNAAGGLLGQKLRNTQIDDGCDAEQAKVAAQLAISSHAVVAMGGACSAAAIDVSRRLAAAKILQFVPNAPIREVREAEIATLFHMTARPDHEGAFAASLIAARWPERRIAVADDGEAVWHEAAESVAASLQQRGLAVPLVTRFAPNRQSYAELVAQLAEQRIGVLFMSGLPADLGVIARQVAATGVPIQLVTGRSGKVDVFQQSAGKAAEGVFAPERRDWTARALADPVLAAEKTRGGEINVYVANGFASLKVWSEAVASAGSFDAERVAAVIKRGRFSTPFGTLAFDANGDLTAESEEWSWYRWHDGGAEPVE